MTCSNETCGQGRNRLSDDVWRGRAQRLFFMTLVALSGSAIGSIATADDADFRVTVAPFLKQYCLRCHGAENPQSDVRLDALVGRLLPDGGETERWASIFVQLERREMPPEGEPSPSDEQREAVLQWLRDELRRVGKGELAAGHAYPERGNYLDHKLLFGKQATERVGATPARLWRMSPFQYEDLQRSFGGERFSNPLSLAGGPGFRDYAFRYSVGPAEARQLLLNAETLIDQLTNPRKKGQSRAAREIVGLLQFSGTPPASRIEEAVKWLFQRLMLREPTADELSRYTDLTAADISELGTRRGAVQGLAPIFTHPEVLYRTELGHGPPDEYGRKILSPRELVFAVAFALTDKYPDETLRLAAAEGRLTTREDVRREVTRILNDPAIETPRILRFFQEYFDYYRAPEVFKDKNLATVSLLRVPELVRDTDQLVLHVLRQDRQVLRELLTTDLSFVHSIIVLTEPQRAKDNLIRNVHKGERPGWLGTFYSLTPEQWSPAQPMKMPTGQRAGILSQPSWLYTHSMNLENQPIQRGEWVYKHLLGGTIPDVPITVDAQLPDEPHNTLRERMRFTLDAYCWRCHQRMNPIGLTFEMFDHYGQFRKTETVIRPRADRKDRTGPVEVALDATGGIEKSPEPSLNGPAESAIELLHRLGRSEHVEQVFVRHAFRYWMGRNETLDDAQALQDAHRAYRESDGSMKSLITSLLTSDPFLYRRTEPAPTLGQLPAGGTRG